MNKIDALLAEAKEALGIYTGSPKLSDLVRRLVATVETYDRLEAREVAATIINRWLEITDLDTEELIAWLDDAGLLRVSALEAESNTTVTPQLVEAVESIMDDENHDNLCGCGLWPASCVTYGNRKPWSYGLEGTLEALAILGTRFPVVPSAVGYPEQETKA